MKNPQKAEKLKKKKISTSLLFWFWVFFCISDVFPARFWGLESRRKNQNRLRRDKKNPNSAGNGGRGEGGPKIWDFGRKKPKIWIIGSPKLGFRKKKFQNLEFGEPKIWI